MADSTLKKDEKERTTADQERQLSAAGLAFRAKMINERLFDDCGGSRKFCEPVHRDVSYTLSQAEKE